jgi:hypothetical protein
MPKALHDCPGSRLPKVETMTIHFTCPSCREPVTIDDCQAGWTVVCPRCHKFVPVPACDYYEVLQVSPNADEEAIRTAYRLLATRLHPDKMPGDPEAAERMKLLNAAYEVLSDRRNRREYDFKRTSAKIGKIVAQPRQARPNEERPGRNSTEAKKDFSPGAVDDEAPGRCWLCKTGRSHGRALSVRLFFYRGYFSILEATVDIPRCSRCERAANSRGWSAGLGCLSMLLSSAIFSLSWELFLSGQESAILYHACILFFCGGCVLFLLGFLGYSLHKGRAKEFPKVRHLLNRGWRLGSLIFPW